MKKFTITLSTLIILSCSSLHAQNSSKAEKSVVLTEAQLTSIAEILYQYRQRGGTQNSVAPRQVFYYQEEATRSNNTYNRNDDFEQRLRDSYGDAEIEELKRTIAELKRMESTSGGSNDMMNDYLKERYNDVFSRVAELEVRNMNPNGANGTATSYSGQSRSAGSTHTVVATGGSKAADTLNRNAVKQAPLADDTLQKMNAAGINTANTKLDSLYGVINNLQRSQTRAQEVPLTSNNRAPVVAANVSDNSGSSYDNLVKLYGDYDRQIYFDHASAKVDNNARSAIKEIADIMKSHPDLDAYIRGYASNVGSAEVNQKLSNKRTEHVKQTLVQHGIHPKRIVSQFHGIDYSSNDDGNARRADVSFIIRR